MSMQKISDTAWRTASPEETEQLGAKLAEGLPRAGDLKGILLALLAAFFYAFVVIQNKKLHGLGAYDRTILQLGVSALVLLGSAGVLPPPFPQAAVKRKKKTNRRRDNRFMIVLLSAPKRVQRWQFRPMKNTEPVPGLQVTGSASKRPALHITSYSIFHS